MSGDAEQFAGDLAEALVSYHKADLTGGNKKIIDAVMIKMVALVSLAFDLPAVTGEVVNVDDALEKLRAALKTLEAKT